ncbi:lysine transporter LysE [Paenibacillus pectinilyticus]|uniref:Lysine transporter LysE n=1 Tax=Paenibacillus pectinilyticus TaxID=512399 RepID=A0A1C1A5R5_9BACL|nr:LysE family transporter [Paenibacillus pectinilyticus]OCT15887.1 lysine transporter LysE [Paenibacillus pectinilyticus]
MFFPLLKGLLLGFSIAAPVGPIGILCMRRTLTLGRLHGFLSGLGAATADAIYGFIAGFGLTLITSFLLDQKVILQLVGGLFLIYLGVQTFRSKPAAHAAKATGDTLFKSYASTLLLTITNPMTIMSFVGAFAGLGLGGSGDAGFTPAIALVIGVFTGSALWWFLLSLVIGIFRDRIQGTAFLWINRMSGLMLIAFGLFAVMGLLFRE